MSDTYRETHETMADALRACGWTATVVGMGGGALGIMLPTDDDETDVLVSGPGWYDDEDTWLVRPACQSHPEYDEASARPIPSAHDLRTTAQRLSLAAITQAKYGPHACPDCADRY